MNLKNSSQGIGFIEVMTLTVIISIACVGLMMGVVHARGELHSLEIEERATEELLNYMEYWKGRIADGSLSVYELAGDPDGDEIFLVGGMGQRILLRQRLYYDLRRLNPFNDYGNTDLTRYELECWIKWGDRFTSPTGRYAGDTGYEENINNNDRV